MMKKIIALFLLALSMNAWGADKTVKCDIQSAGSTPYQGQCIFTPEPTSKGSFTLSAPAQGNQLTENVTSVSVIITAKNTAEVSGLTTSGINSRWGEAKRSKKDKACWQGTDFKVCAWSSSEEKMTGNEMNSYN